MRFVQFVAVTTGLLLAQEVTANDLVPRWSYGPTAALTAVGKGDDGLYHSEFLTAGLGFQPTVNFVDAANFPWLGLRAAPHAG